MQPVINQKRALRQCLRAAISAPQIKFSNRNVAQIGTTPSAQTNGSPVVEFNPRSWGETQLYEDANKQMRAPTMFANKRAIFTLRDIQAPAS